MSPGRCTAPTSKYSRVLDVKPRLQWRSGGGYCGELSLQTSALNFGAWISQSVARRAASRGEGHGDPSGGYEILPSNVAESARNLGLLFDEWDHAQPKPQSEAFKRWLKAHLVQGHPIVWFPILQGDSHDPYGRWHFDTPNGGAFDHVEPMWGIGSNHPLNDTTVYDDDWIVHGSDHDYKSYYRFINSLQDDTRMMGNCGIARPGFGKNQMYPCFFDQVTYGLAVKGLNVTGGLPVTLSVDRRDEPDVRGDSPRGGSPPAQLHGTVNVSGLDAGKHYVLYRYAGAVHLPAGPSFEESSFEQRTPFTAVSSSWVFRDPAPIVSSGSTYYIAAEGGEGGTPQTAAPVQPAQPSPKRPFAGFPRHLSSRPVAGATSPVGRAPGRLRFSRALRAIR